MDLDTGWGYSNILTPRVHLKHTRNEIGTRAALGWTASTGSQRTALPSTLMPVSPTGVKAVSVSTLHRRWHWHWHAGALSLESHPSMLSAPAAAASPLSPARLNKVQRALPEAACCCSCPHAISSRRRTLVMSNRLVPFPNCT